jgi:predicted transcriptional regulator
MTSGTVYLNTQMMGDAINNKALKGAWRTIFSLIQNIEVHNIVNTSVADMAEQIDIKASILRSHLKALEDAGLIEVVADPYTIKINPELAWKGSTQSHLKALKARGWVKRES